MPASPQSSPSATTLPTGWSGGLQCQSCGAALDIGAVERTTQCPYCASPAVIERAADRTRPAPTFALGFVVTKDAALARARQFIRKSMFTPTAFAKADVTQTRGIYVPAYLFTGAAHVTYSASIGENYTVVETYTTTDAQGRTVTRTRTKTVTEWRSLTGNYAAYVDDILVTASRGLHNSELEAVEPFDLRAIIRYTPKLISGWIAEEPSLSPVDCGAQARREAIEKIGARLNSHMPGDRHRNLQYEARIADEDLELLLLPVWVLAVRYDDKRPPVRLLINGQTGEFVGKAPRSWIKIVATVVGVLLAIAAVYMGMSLG